jgi:hypothetical protein
MDWSMQDETQILADATGASAIRSAAVRTAATLSLIGISMMTRNTDPSHGGSGRRTAIKSDKP